MQLKTGKLGDVKRVSRTRELPPSPTSDIQKLQKGKLSLGQTEMRSLKFRTHKNLKISDQSALAEYWQIEPGLCGNQKTSQVGLERCL